MLKGLDISAVVNSCVALLAGGAGLRTNLLYPSKSIAAEQTNPRQEEQLQLLEQQLRLLLEKAALESKNRSGVLLDKSELQALLSTVRELQRDARKLEQQDLEQQDFENQGAADQPEAQEFPNHTWLAPDRAERSGSHGSSASSSRPQLAKTWKRLLSRGRKVSVLRESSAGALPSFEELQVGEGDPVAYRIAYRLLREGSSVGSVAMKVAIPLKDVLRLEMLRQQRDRQAACSEHLKGPHRVGALDQAGSLPEQALRIEIERSQMLL